MMHLKSCPKCQGDMYVDSDAYGPFHQCLQCGLIKDVVDPSSILAQPPQPKVAAKRDATKGSGRQIAA